MKPWKRIEPTKVHKIGWRTVVSKTFELPDDKTAVFDTLWPEGQEVVVILALTAEKKAIIARQFRPGPEKILEELPAGFVDGGESPEAAARRELQEETGYTAGTMGYLGEMYMGAYNNQILHCFLATDCARHKDGQQLEEGEYIEVVLITIDQLLENAKNARMLHTEPVLLGYDELQKIKEHVNDKSS